MSRAWTVLRFSVLLSAAVCCAGPASAQYQGQGQSDDAHRSADLDDPGWQVIRAEWGAGSRWADVTHTVRMLLSGNGSVKVNNMNMGGDPAVGADKVLRIHARNFQGQHRQFTFKEGGSIDASQFYNYGGRVGGGNAAGWQVTWAEWGAGNRRANVTDRVRALLSGNGTVRVNNANMGGDPAVGADKTLWISARDARGQTRQFTYKEGGTIDASQFYDYGNPPEPGRPGPGDAGGPGTGYPTPGYGPLEVVRAYYGLNNRTADVTDRLRRMVQGNSLAVQVNNNNLGGDPAIGADKVLTVIYRYGGQEQSATVKEGHQLRIP
jgi:hypothetical protein